jgi:hypothetical protein
MVNVPFTEYGRFAILKLARVRVALLIFNVAFTLPAA